MDNSYIQKIYQAFPIESHIKPVEHLDLSKWDFENLQVPKFLNFIADKPSLFELSGMIESYAVRNNSPLIAGFENESRYKYVEGRYANLIKTLPKIWIIGDFNNPFLSQHSFPNASVISCNGTPLTIDWIVLTRDKNGPLGLVAEEIQGEMFKGFFSTNPIICGKPIIPRTCK